MSYTVALSGDVILNTPVAGVAEAGTRELLAVLGGADVTHAHLEIPLHDFEPGAYPAAEGALSWMRGPTSVARELRDWGVDLVSTASNHALDYSYGRLRATAAALDEAGLPHAGTGADLAAARAPAFADTAVARVALVSATSSFPAFAAAGPARADHPGRPGVNPVRTVHVVDPGTAEQVAATAAALGQWVLRARDELVVHPPGLHNSITRFRVDPDVAAPTTACDADDLDGYLRSIRYARSVSDLVIAHLHVQAWGDGRMSVTPAFASQLAHAAVAAGAGVVLLQGAHAPMRGIEVHNGVPVLHDPGPLFRLGRRERQPQEFYQRWGNPAAVRSPAADLLDAYAARDRSGELEVLGPREGISHRPGGFLPVCEVEVDAADTHRVRRLHLHPFTWSTTRRATTGFPVPADPVSADAILTRVADLSSRHGVIPVVRDGRGVVEVVPG